MADFIQNNLSWLLLVGMFVYTFIQAVGWTMDRVKLRKYEDLWSLLVIENKVDGRVSRIGPGVALAVVLAKLVEERNAGRVPAEICVLVIGPKHECRLLTDADYTTITVTKTSPDGQVETSATTLGKRSAIVGPDSPEKCRSCGDRPSAGTPCEECGK